MKRTMTTLQASGIAILLAATTTYAQLPDLHPTDVHLNGLAVSGEQVQWVYTVTNAGDGPIQDGYAWTDYAWLSTNPTSTADAWLVGPNWHQLGPLAAGSSYTRTNTITLPSVQPGTYYLILQTDVNGMISETDENNNAPAFAVQVVVPDLHPTDVHLNGLAVSGEQVQWVYTVTNAGDGPIQDGYAWTDYAWLSTNPTSTADAWLVGPNWHQLGPLAAGSSYTRTNTITLPSVQPGTYYLILQTDVNGMISEIDENNNAPAFAVRIVDPVLDMPRADAGPDSARFVGQSALLDGSLSSNAQHYSWVILSRPVGSSVALLDPGTATPTLIPDLPGEYIAQLVVDFYGLTSTPDTVTITASWLNWTVDSHYGHPTPGTGVHNVAYSTLLTNIVDSATETGETQYVCSGWTLAEHDPATGTSNQFSVVITNIATLTWLWTTNYWLEVQATGSGTLSHATGWYPAGSTQIVSTIPAYGWLFTGWSGDVTAGHTVSNMDLVMNRPWHLAASFSDDPDGDGLKNVDEWSHGSDPWNPDTDDDGFGDGWEVQHGWNPTIPDNDVVPYILARPGVFGVYSASSIGSLSPGSLFIAASSNTVQLSIQLETSPDLLPTAWTNAGPPLDWSMPVATNKAFYRVGIRE